ncbi:hypothetical protein LG943_06450 [Streptomonospora sp. S1-112]|uniref:Uncharacterized protein n=1 Tax=Streptomonospora mangrovi TaxID=2883123 RepID=A0A9X3SDL3_9ACTN|nr:hypothetical protein [Streptomonospora mangrovi]MDA0563967.1 hypothetical protein [Streptomonospora mangrovi]
MAKAEWARAAAGLTVTSVAAAATLYGVSELTRERSTAPGVRPHWADAGALTAMARDAHDGVVQASLKSRNDIAVLTANPDLYEQERRYFHSVRLNRSAEVEKDYKEHGGVFGTYAMDYNRYLQSLEYCIGEGHGVDYTSPQFSHVSGLPDDVGDLKPNDAARFLSNSGQVLNAVAKWAERYAATRRGTAQEEQAAALVANTREYVRQFPSPTEIDAAQRSDEHALESGLFTAAASAVKTANTAESAKTVKDLPGALPMNAETLAAGRSNARRVKRRPQAPTPGSARRAAPKAT